MKAFFEMFAIDWWLRSSDFRLDRPLNAIASIRSIRFFFSTLFPEEADGSRRRVCQSEKPAKKPQKNPLQFGRESSYSQRAQVRQADEGAVQ